MKTIALLLTIFVPLFSFAEKFKVSKISKHVCQKKYVTVHGEYSPSDQKVIISTHKNIKDLIIVDAHGLDGLTIVNFSEVSLGDVAAGSSVDSLMNLNIPGGKESILVLRVNYQLGGRDIDEIVTVGIGQLSQQQKNERKKNVVNKNGKKLHLFSAD